MIIVVLESPYAGDVARNVEYAQKCVADCFKRGEAAFASHLLYTQPNILDDNIPEERKLGIRAGYEFIMAVDYVVFYEDLGWSGGMLAAKDFCLKHDIRFEVRCLPI